MFLDYRKPSNELVIDLINRDNPDLPTPLTLDNCKLGLPVAFVEGGGGWRNTIITVMFNDSSIYMGPLQVRYRRLTPNELFPGGRVLIDHYRESGIIPEQEYVDLINDKYGTAIHPDELTNFNMGNSVHTGSISFVATCRAYVGSIPYSRVQALIPINVPVSDPVSDWLVAQPVGSIDYSPVLFGADFTPFDHLIKAVGNTFQNRVEGRLLERVMSEYSGTLYGDRGNKPFNTNTIRATIYKLPNNSAPNANVEYDNVMVITPLNANSWLKGTIHLHYNEDV